MRKVFINIRKEDIKEANINISNVYDIKPLPHSLSWYNMYYVRLSYGRLNYSGMENFMSIDILLQEYETVDYYDWLKENEVIIAGIKFGLL